MQLLIRRWIAIYKRRKYEGIWPINNQARACPEHWHGWPEGKQFAFLLSHDVDTLKGYRNVLKLADFDEQMGFRSTFNFVPERYGRISLELLKELKERGFGIGVHGLNHDGKLFYSKRIFARKAIGINKYLKEWGTCGFTSPSTHHNLAWMSALNIDYATTTFDTDPFEPQPDHAKTIFPFLVENGIKLKEYVELPYTLPQDHLLFVILKEKKIDIWKRKIDWIAQMGGMALLNTHPDYIRFNGKKPNGEDYPIKYYGDFLQYVKNRYSGIYHHTLASEISQFWRMSSSK